MEKIRNFAKSVLDLLYPDHAQCMGCGELTGTEEGWLCEECAETIKELSMLERTLCMRCGQEIQKGRVCDNCGDWPDDGVFAARYCYGYAEPVSRAVRQMKYAGVSRMMEWMGGEMAALIERGDFGTVDLLVPVPMHPARVRERCRNHAQCIAEALSRETGIPEWDGLARIRNTKQQARRKGEKRKTAMEGAFSVQGDTKVIAGKRILLVDDVITTGATVNSCARVLYACGAECVCAAAFAGHLSVQENTDDAKRPEGYTK